MSVVAAEVLGIMHDGKEYGGCNAPDCPAKLGYFMGSNSKENRLKFSPCSKRCVKYRLKFPANRCIVKKCDEKNEV
uniref:Putative M12B metalloprotease n=1 Tax=Hottentotta judaicus TaxID=6863 RepID=F1CIY4_HOTJU|nr:putative M12B metalloprotease [Hottentotta judaicus]